MFLSWREIMWKPSVVAWRGITILSPLLVAPFLVFFAFFSFVLLFYGFLLPLCFSLYHPGYKKLGIRFCITWLVLSNYNKDQSVNASFELTTRATWKYWIFMIPLIFHIFTKRNCFIKAITKSHIIRWYWWFYKCYNSK